MNIIDGFSGSGSAMQPLVDNGHMVVGFDLIEGPHTVVGDVMHIAKNVQDWVEAHFVGAVSHGHFSPPCESWAVGAVGKNWTLHEKVYSPKSERAEMGVRILDATIRIIEELGDMNPDFTFTMENPAGIMHKWLRQHDHWLVDYENIISYCAYGPIGPVPVIQGPEMVYAQKTTIIWTDLPSFTPKRCISRPPKAKVVPAPIPGFDEIGLEFVERGGSPCHERAPRGARSGIQRIKGAGARAIFPQEFAHSLCKDVEVSHGL